MRPLPASWFWLVEGGAWVLIGITNVVYIRYRRLRRQYRDLNARAAAAFSELDDLRSRYAGPIDAPRLVAIGDPTLASQIQQLSINANTPDGYCGVCGLEILGPNLRLEMAERTTGENLTVTVCRYCLAEYMPELLERLESPE